jgi:hypothetical protein
MANLLKSKTEFIGWKKTGGLEVAENIKTRRKKEFSGLRRNKWTSKKDVHSKRKKDDRLAK